MVIVVHDVISVFDGFFVDALIYKKCIPRSAWRVWLDTNHGTFVIERNIFDWNVCRTFVLEVLLQPHSSIPYVQIGFNMIL
jgi:hypothetical protein